MDSKKITRTIRDLKKVLRLAELTIWATSKIKKLSKKVK